MERIDIPKLVTHIKEAEYCHSSGKWDKYTKNRGLGKQMSQWWWAAPYEEYVTGLYTLRAYLRGKMHRQNPPAPIRDFNRTMEETGSRERMTWLMEEHNRILAEKTAKGYLLQEQEEQGVA